MIIHVTWLCHDTGITQETSRTNAEVPRGTQEARSHTQEGLGRPEMSVSHNSARDHSRMNSSSLTLTKSTACAHKCMDAVKQCGAQITGSENLPPQLPQQNLLGNQLEHPLEGNPTSVSPTSASGSFTLWYPVAFLNLKTCPFASYSYSCPKLRFA